ncbi:MAG: cytochrome c maturation protein CcmE [Bacteroidota bacterium]|nr:cytochrome c maturation protein CcmE [Bacteroidota bacterium]
MKPVQIVILVFVSVAIAIGISFYGDTSKYVCFQEADEIAKSRPNLKLHVVTTLSKDKPSVYNPQVDPNYFEFYASDTTGLERRIVYRNAMPQDLDKTDKVVLIGYSRGDYFEAKDILKKCPSKYEKP